jgi:predicted PurR-regulated permease PerM
VLAAKAVRGVVLGVVLTALTQAALGGIGLFIAGVPAAALLTAVVFILCLAQLGPVLVLVPSVVWLYWSGQAVSGTVLLIFSVFAATIDNFMRPLLIRKQVDLPLLLVIAGVIGGLIAFDHRPSLHRSFSQSLTLLRCGCRTMCTRTRQF